MFALTAVVFAAVFSAKSPDGANEIRLETADVTLPSGDRIPVTMGPGGGFTMRVSQEQVVR